MISIIIVTLNAAKTLQACLDSIYSQSYKNIEIVVLDGASTDQTPAILQANSHKLAYYKSEPDAGIYHAMNKALAYIRGNWVYFLGADDTLLPGFSELALQLKDPKTIYYANVLFLGKPLGGYKTAYRHAKENIFHQAIIYPAAVFSKYNYNARYVVNADHVLNTQLFSDPGFALEYKNILIAHYNHTGFSTLNYDKAYRKDYSKLVMRHYGFAIWSRFLFKHIKAWIGFPKYNKIKKQVMSLITRSKK